MMPTHVTKIVFSAIFFILSMPAISQAMYPAIKDLSSDPAGKCERLSQRAKVTGVKVLIVGFEGMAMYSPMTNATLYRLHINKSTGKALGPMPRSGFGGLMAAGLLGPVVAKYGDKLEVIVFGETEITMFSGGYSKPEVCARAWMKVPGRKLIVVGHSNGAQSAGYLAASLGKRGIPVDSVFTLDGVIFKGNISRVGKVKNWENYYQSLPAPLPGQSVYGADQNVNLTGQASHGSVPAHPAVARSLGKRLRLLTGAK